MQKYINAKEKQLFLLRCLVILTFLDSSVQNDILYYLTFTFM